MAAFSPSLPILTKCQGFSSNFTVYFTTNPFLARKQKNTSLAPHPLFEPPELVVPQIKRVFTSITVLFSSCHLFDCAYSYVNLPMSTCNAGRANAPALLGGWKGGGEDWEGWEVGWEEDEEEEEEEEEEVVVVVWASTREAASSSAKAHLITPTEDMPAGLCSSANVRDMRLLRLLTAN